MTADEAARELAIAGRRLVNASLPPDMDREREFWRACRNMRATLAVCAGVTGVDGEQDPPEDRRL